MSLVDYLVSAGYLKTPSLIKAFTEIKRIDFLPEDLKSSAELNEALPIGEGQTISQPAVVAFMLEILQPKAREKILDIGSGSGWTSALLSFIVSENKKNKKGKVFAIEVIPELKNFGQNNNSKYNFVKDSIVSFILGDGRKGFKKEAQFDKILVSAAAYKIPEPLKEQLKIGGRLVMPVKDEKSDIFSSQSIWLVEKKNQKEFIIKKYPGFVFVPLVQKH